MVLASGTGKIGCSMAQIDGCPLQESHQASDHPLPQCDYCCAAGLPGHASFRRGSGNRLEDRRVTESGKSRSSRESSSRMDTSIHT